MGAEKIKKLIEQAKETPYYGLRYGHFVWVRGQIDIFDLDDIKYVQICLDKIKKRLQLEDKEKKKNAS